MEHLVDSLQTVLGHHTTPDMEAAYAHFLARAPAH